MEILFCVNFEIEPEKTLFAYKTQTCGTGIKQNFRFCP